MRPTRLVVRVAGLLAAVAAIVGAIVGVAALRVADAHGDVDAAVDLIDQASVALAEGRLADAKDDLSEAYTLVSGVNGTLHGSPELELSALLPVARQNLAVVRDAVALALRLVDGGRRVLDAAGPLEGSDGQLEVSLSDGSLPLEAVAATQREIRALVWNLPAGASRMSRAVLPALAGAADALHAEALRRRSQLVNLDRGLSLLTELAGGNGDRRYLLAIANTAEMRGSGGMILNYGVLEGAAGTIDLTAFGRIDELVLPTGVVVPELPEDYLQRWAGFDPLSRWRNANLAGDFTIVAPVLQAMYTAATGQTVDGVIQIDPTGLARMLDGIGPVQVAEVGVVDPASVVPLTLNEAYLRFPGVEQRTDVLGDVAEAAFRRLVDGEIPSLRRLATGLVEAVDGRHILAHAGSRDAQTHLAAFGADGSLPPLDEHDSFHLTTQNLSGNKLDYYLDTHLDLTGSIDQGEPAVIEAEVVLTNSAPTGVTEPAYIFGPGPTTTPLPAGVVRSLVTLYLPFGTSLQQTEGGPLVEPAVSGTEGGRPFATFTVDVPAGASRAVSLTLAMRPGAAAASIDAVPSPRVRPTTLSVDIATSAGVIRGDVELDRRWRFSTTHAPDVVEPPAFSG